MKLLILLAFVLSGCSQIESLASGFDRKSFELIGGTVFAEADLLTMKEIHLDTGILQGREVIIEGNILDVGKYFTHMVLSDESARMLVVLTKVDARSYFKKQEVEQKSIRILGTIENGKKGFPYILAKAITFSDIKS